MHPTFQRQLKYHHHHKGDKTRKKDMIPKAIFGQLPEGVEHEECSLIVDIEGILCRLLPIDKDSVTQYEAFRRRCEKRPPRNIEVNNFKRTARKRHMAAGGGNSASKERSGSQSVRSILFNFSNKNFNFEDLFECVFHNLNQLRQDSRELISRQYTSQQTHRLNPFQDSRIKEQQTRRQEPIKGR